MNYALIFVFLHSPFQPPTLLEYNIPRPTPHIIYKHESITIPINTAPLPETKYYNELTCNGPVYSNQYLTSAGGVSVINLVRAVKSSINSFI